VRASHKAPSSAPRCSSRDRRLPKRP
jgi:hypothetical protein